MTAMPPKRKAAPFQVFLKNDDGVMPSQDGHWTPSGQALMIPLRTTGEPSYVGHVALPEGPTIHFRAQPSRKGTSPPYDRFPDFNFFVTDEHGNVFKPDGHTWRSFDGKDYCEPGFLDKCTRPSDKKQYLKGNFVYLGKRRFIQLWFDFKEKQRQAAAAPALPMEATS